MSQQKILQLQLKDKSPHNPKSLVILTNKYLHHLAIKNYSNSTIEGKTFTLKIFIEWCYERYITIISEVNKSILEIYLSHLYQCSNKRTGEKLKIRSIQKRISSVSSLFRWATKNNYILMNPADSIPLPKVKRTLPGSIFTLEEVETILNTPDITKGLGIRDRAILELLYSSGIRRAEVLNLAIPDIDFEKELLIVKEGKGRKDRYVPVTERACSWLKKYLREVRPTIADEQSKDIFFLAKNGNPFARPASISILIRKHIEKSGVQKQGACHIFRHTMATLMLENGADLRYIQEILGHREVSTTQIYTRVSIKELRRVHFRTHPGNLFLEEDEHER